MLFCFSAYAYAEVKVSIDAATFKHTKDSVLWEMYYVINNDNITYVEENGQYVAKVFFNVTLKSALDDINQKWLFQNIALNKEQTKGLVLFGVKQFFVKEGQYVVNIKVNDFNDDNSSSEKSFKIITPDYKLNKIETSDIRLSKIAVDEDDSDVQWDPMFYKNGFFAIPNPAVEYFDSDPFVRFYHEIYNLGKYAKEPVLNRITIHDALENVKINLKDTVENISDDYYYIKEIPINSLATGVYYLKTAVLYPLSNPTDSVINVKKFYFINSAKPPESTDKFYVEGQKFELSEFAAMSESQIEHEMEIIEIIGTNFDRDQIELLGTTKAKRRYLFEYWTVHDEDPQTPRNETLEKIREAEKYANTYFSWGRSDNGWKTDRGKIMLKYGFPADRNLEVATAGKRAWSDWWYPNVQGGTNFYFVDIGGFGDFRLVHSTVQGEIYHADWYNQFAPDSRNNPNND